MFVCFIRYMSSGKQCLFKIQLAFIEDCRYDSVISNQYCLKARYSVTDNIVYFPYPAIPPMTQRLLSVTETVSEQYTLNLEYFFSKP